MTRKRRQRGRTKAATEDSDDEQDDGGQKTERPGKGTDTATEDVDEETAADRKGDEPVADGPTVGTDASDHGADETAALANDDGEGAETTDPEGPGFGVVSGALGASITAYAWGWRRDSEDSSE